VLELIFYNHVNNRISVQNEDGSWRNRMNYELNELIGTADMVRFTKKVEE